MLIAALIISILIMLAVPAMQDVALRLQLKNGEATLVHALTEARQIARARGTIVTVTVADNQLRLTAANQGDFVQERNFPAQIRASEITELRFSPVGTVTRASDTIELLPRNSHSSDARRRISISPLGVISTL